MEKLTLERFRDLKREVIELINNIYDTFDDEEEKKEKLIKSLDRYKEIIGILSNHDLSDIDFEEWKGMNLFTSSDLGITFDFSKTNANIDFSKIEYEFDEKCLPNFRNCNIKNFDFNKMYNEEMFDDDFKAQNTEWFLDENVSEEIKREYYERTLTLEEFSDNLQLFEGKKVANAFNRNMQDTTLFAKIYGDNIYEEFKNNKFIMDLLIAEKNSIVKIMVEYFEPTSQDREQIMRRLMWQYITRNGYIFIQNWQEFKMVTNFLPIENMHFTTKIWDLINKYGIDTIIASGLDIKYILHGKNLSNIEEINNVKGIEFEDLELLMDDATKKVLEKYDIKQLIEYGVKDLSEITKVVQNLHEIKSLLETRPIDLISFNGKYQASFIEKYGIDNIIKLDEETGGMFSHKMWDGINIYLELMSYAENKLPKIDDKEKISYEQFRDRMYEALLHARDQRGVLTSRDFENYDFINGKFREEHQEIFLDGDLPKKIKDEFYFRTMNFETVRQYPELIKLLNGKDLSRVFAREIMIGTSATVKDEQGNRIGSIPIIENMADYLSKELGYEDFLQICADYGSCLDKIVLSLPQNITTNNVREEIEDKIYYDIKNKGIEYFEGLPLGFQKKHPDLFLPKDIDVDIRNRFYKGELSFEDIKNNPQIKDILLTKDISVGLGKTKYGNEMLGRKTHDRYINKMWQVLTEQEIMDLAEKYGQFLNAANDMELNDYIEFEDKEKEIQDIIEKKILDRKALYSEECPEFFKKKHPDMFLDEDAPEALKLLFYDNKIKLKNNKRFDFYMIADNPEWKKFLKGKDISRALPELYSELNKKFDKDSFFRLGTKNPESVEMMVLNGKEDILEKWYKSTGGRFVPHHVVMLNFPEDEMDSFLENGKKWSALMKIDGYNLNDDGKTAILKAAYAMGVFQGDDEGFNRTFKMFTDIPQELSIEEFSEIKEKLKLYGSYISFEKDFDSERKQIDLFISSYRLNEDGKYILSIDKQKDKDKVKEIRKALEQARYSKILTTEIAHQMFDSFAMEYNPDFARFLFSNFEEILLNMEYIKDIATIQRQFKEIARTNSGRRLTLEVAEDYIKSIAYDNIDIGNERLAEQAKIAGYSQKDFEILQDLYNEGELRDFSSIPRVQGNLNGYSYEILRLDDPLALTIGTLTDCCQEINGAGKTSMEHSVVSQDGRVFCVKDADGRIVAQSWFWRNQYTGCFDNIEIPRRIFELYEKQHPDVGRNGLTQDVLEVYKKATQDLMKEDARVYQELLENGTITQEQYDALRLKRVTIGAGYNDINYALREAHKRGEMGLDQSNEVLPKPTARLRYIYDDAHFADDGIHDGQYIVAEEEGIVKSEYEDLYVYQDDIPVYDGENMPSILLMTMKRMEGAEGRERLVYLREKRNTEKMSKSQRIINSIAEEYELDEENTKIMATARMAIIYSKDKDKIEIADIFTAPAKERINRRAKTKI